MGRFGYLYIAKLIWSEPPIFNPENVKSEEGKKYSWIECIFKENGKRLETIYPVNNITDTLHKISFLEQR